MLQAVILEHSVRYATAIVQADTWGCRLPSAVAGAQPRLRPGAAGVGRRTAPGPNLNPTRSRPRSRPPSRLQNHWNSSRRNPKQPKSQPPNIYPNHPYPSRPPSRRPHHWSSSRPNMPSRRNPNRSKLPNRRPHHWSSSRRNMPSRRNPNRSKLPNRRRRPNRPKSQPPNICQNRPRSSKLLSRSLSRRPNHWSSSRRNPNRAPRARRAEQSPEPPASEQTAEPVRRAAAEPLEFEPTEPEAEPAESEPEHTAEPPPDQAGAVSESEQVVTRAWVHDDFGRIVFDWPGDVGYTASIADKTLTVVFDHRLETTFEQVWSHLGAYITDIALGPDGRTVMAALTDDYRLRTFPLHQGEITKIVLDVLAGPEPDQPTAAQAEAPARVGRGRTAAGRAAGGPSSLRPPSRRRGRTAARPDCRGPAAARTPARPTRPQPRQNSRRNRPSSPCPSATAASSALRRRRPRCLSAILPWPM